MNGKDFRTSSFIIRTLYLILVCLNNSNRWWNGQAMYQKYMQNVWKTSRLSVFRPAVGLEGNIKTDIWRNEWECLDRIRWRIFVAMVKNVQDSYYGIFSPHWVTSDCSVGSVRHRSILVSAFLALEIWTPGQFVSVTRGIPWLNLLHNRHFENG